MPKSPEQYQPPFGGDAINREPTGSVLEQKERPHSNRELLLATESLRRKSIDSFVRNVRSAQSDEKAIELFPDPRACFRLAPDADTLSPEEFRESLLDPEAFKKRKVEEEGGRQEKMREENLILARKIRDPKDDDELVSALFESKWVFGRTPTLFDVVDESRLRRKQNPDGEKASLPTLENLTVSQYRRYRLECAIDRIMGSLGSKNREVIKAIIVLGSTARGNAKEESDVDLFVATNTGQPLEADLASKIISIIKEELPSVELQIGGGHVAIGTRAAGFLTRRSSKHPGEPSVWKFLYSQSIKAQTELNAILKESQDRQRKT